MKVYLVGRGPARAGRVMLREGVGGNDRPPRTEGHRNEMCQPGAEDVGEKDSVCHLEA